MKRIFFFAPVLFFALLQGCLNYEQEVTLYPDGSGKMRIHYWVEMPNRTELANSGTLYYFNKDSLRVRYKSPYFSIDNIQSYADSTDTTRHVILDISFSKYDSLDEALQFRGFQISVKEGASRQFVLNHTISPLLGNFALDSSAVKLTYKYDIRGDIIQHNAHTRDGNVLTWNFTLPEIQNGKTLTVTYRPYKLKETPLWIYILAGSVLFLVIFFLFRKRRN